MSRFRPASPEVVVIGAGIGGLAAAVSLARRGHPVTVLEAQVYPGGCAATFFHQGYRFDSGATLAGGFTPGGPMDVLARQAGIADWEAAPVEGPLMHVHLPDGCVIPLSGGPERWELRRSAFGPRALPFWEWQERTAAAMWDLALRGLPWPPQTPADARYLLESGLHWLAQGSANPPGLFSLARDAFRPLAAHIPAGLDRLRLALDGQLLISAQATSERANALYGAAALDLPRRGVMHLRGGVGAIAEQLVQALRELGGKALYRQEAVRIVRENGRPIAVETRRGESFPAGVVIGNLLPANMAALLDRPAPPAPPDAWGAFVVYAGVSGQAIPPGAPLHHQVITAEPLAEGSSVFVSISPAWDASRAPHGLRALTLSTHTRLAPWWELANADRQAYAARKEAYASRLVAAAARALPGLPEAVQLLLPGSPVTFARFTRRQQGWVGGFPQTSLFRARGPRVAAGVWMVGDSIFPGQSLAAAALGGLRVGQAVSAFLE